jgi:hypothetical protein
MDLTSSQMETSILGSIGMETQMGMGNTYGKMGMCMQGCSKMG